MYRVNPIEKDLKQDIQMDYKGKNNKIKVLKRISFV